MIEQYKYLMNLILGAVIFLQGFFLDAMQPEDLLENINVVTINNSTQKIKLKMQDAEILPIIRLSVIKKGKENNKNTFYLKVITLSEFNITSIQNDVIANLNEVVISYQEDNKHIVCIPIDSNNDIKVNLLKFALIVGFEKFKYQNVLIDYHDKSNELWKKLLNRYHIDSNSFGINMKIDNNEENNFYLAFICDTQEALEKIVDIINESNLYKKKITIPNNNQDDLEIISSINTQLLSQKENFYDDLNNRFKKSMFNYEFKKHFLSNLKKSFSYILRFPRILYNFMRNTLSRVGFSMSIF